MNYSDFISKKSTIDIFSGFEPEELSSKLFDFQRDIVAWSCRRGRSAIFADCGLGKTAMQLQWANQIKNRVLVVAPLAVGKQTVREGLKFDVSIQFCKKQDEVKEKNIITNYEMLHNFDPKKFEGIVLDESSILKSYTGKFRNFIIDDWGKVKHVLACTATPAPNDFMELGNHSQFLGAMTREEMLSMFFVHDGGDTSKWRLKGHAIKPFWEWVCSWAINIRKPSDLGYDNMNFVLPELEIKQHTVERKERPTTTLFHVEAQTLQERQTERRETVRERAERCAELAVSEDSQYLAWCNLNDEGSALKEMIPGSIEICGSDKQEYKEEMMLAFADGEIKHLITKPKIAGFGMNWQSCNRMGFVGLSDSYEQFYQAVRRCYRFGQKNKVTADIITASTEGAVVRNIERKEKDAMLMAAEMAANMKDINSKQVKEMKRTFTGYFAKANMQMPTWLF